MKLIVGLGNPGNSYKNNRHNVGFMVIDKIAEKLKVSLNKKEFESIYALSDEFILVKPQTFMNKSGICVEQIKNFYKVDISDILIIHDDLDTVLGQAKIKTRGGSGGHNGVRDIITRLNTEEINRLKIGIGRPNKKDNDDIATYVLSDFEEKEMETINLVISLAADAAISAIYNGVKNVINNFNRKEK